MGKVRNAERDAEIRRQHAAGISTPQLMAEYGLSRARIHAICAGLHPFRPDLNTPAVPTAPVSLLEEQLRREYVSLTEALEMLGLHDRKWLATQLAADQFPGAFQWGGEKPIWIIPRAAVEQYPDRPTGTRPPRAGCKLAPAQRAEIRRRFLAGESARQLAAEYDVSRAYVYALRRNHRMKPHGKAANDGR